MRSTETAVITGELRDRAHGIDRWWVAVSEEEEMEQQSMLEDESNEQREEPLKL
jgi:hypothetical protein